MSEIWIPFGKAELAYIPYFAMPFTVAKSRVTYHTAKLEPETLQTELGDVAAAWLHENVCGEFLGFYVTREYLIPRTARYQNWLVFGDKKAAEKFLNKFPEFSSPKIHSRSLPPQLDGETKS